MTRYAFNLVLTIEQQQALDDLVSLMPDVDNKSAAARRAIIEMRDLYKILDNHRRRGNDDQAQR